MPSDIFRCVLEFAYFDSPSCFDRVRSIENRCEILAAADLLLMDRLKQIAEAQVSSFFSSNKNMETVHVIIRQKQPIGSQQQWRQVWRCGAHSMNVGLLVRAGSWWENATEPNWAGEPWRQKWSFPHHS